MEEKKKDKEYRKQLCRLYYNEKDRKFIYQPYNKKKEEFYDIPEIEGATILTKVGVKLESMLPFTDMVDAMKLMFGSERFTLKIVKVLLDMYKGKHDAFKENMNYFHPMNINKSSIY